MKRFVIVATDRDCYTGIWFTVDAKNAEQAQLAVRQNLADANLCDLADVPFTLNCCIPGSTLLKALKKARPDLTAKETTR